MRYAGDGLLALWPCEPWAFDTPDQLCRRAVKCSLAMIEELNNYEITREVKLQLHMGLGTGSIIIMVVGSELGWECIVGGEPLSQISVVVDEAKPGETVLAKEGW
jgi:class 3 adenylate cyclase